MPRNRDGIKGFLFVSLQKIAKLGNFIGADRQVIYSVAGRLLLSELFREDMSDADRGSVTAQSQHDWGAVSEAGLHFDFSHAVCFVLWDLGGEIADVLSGEKFRACIEQKEFVIDGF